MLMVLESRVHLKMINFKFTPTSIEKDDTGVKPEN